ncbi:putative hydrolase of the HAD superfamily [Pseudobutyrivibrio sp. YE44]|nr:putative hydrolase of the HAD superfamily [Pseudobutyrivibrio sp. YE44]
MKYKNYIFDLYGTLIDIHTDEDQPELWKFMAEYLEKNFGTKYDYKVLKKEYGKLCKQETEALAERNGSKHPEIKIQWVWQKLIDAPCSDEQMKDLCTAFREKSRDKLVRYEGVKETLASIKQAGGKVYLLSNAQRLFTEKELEDTELTQYFDDIFISSDMEIKKPDGAFLQQLIDKHSLVKSESVMIGNEIFADVGVAAAVGLDAIYLNTYSRSKREINHNLKRCGADINKVKFVDDGDIRKIE